MSDNWACECCGAVLHPRRQETGAVLCKPCEKRPLFEFYGNDDPDA